MEQVQDGRCFSSHFITKWPYSWDQWCPSPAGQAHLTSRPRQQFISRLDPSSQVGPQSSHHLGSGVCEGELWEFQECPRCTLLTPHLSTEPSLSERSSYPALWSHCQSGPAFVFTHLGGVRGSAPATSGPIS